MKTLRIGCLFAGLLSLALSLSAQTFTTLHSFNQTDGSEPEAGLVQATDGNLYGTTYRGGAGNFGFGGAVFKITPGGTLSTLYSFCNLSQCGDGAGPYAGVVQGTDGHFYGTTSEGGTNYGVVFKVTPGGTFTTLHSFADTDGANPQAGLVQGSDGNFYGTTPFSQASSACPLGCGTVFKVTPGGTLTTLHTFVGTDGFRPLARMIQGTDGNFYGTTFGGGASPVNGTVFKITPGGVLTTLHSFAGTDGANPYGALVQATNGSFYGTTLAGGGGNGTLFKITPGGTLTTLYIFCSQGSGCPDGENPRGDLIQATDGNLYGTTTGAGGSSNGGTVFKITLGGTLTTLYTFCSQGGTKCTDGLSPVAGLVQDTNGTFYGTTNAGGSGLGTVFSLSMGLAPVVAAEPGSGRVGATSKLLGQGFPGTTGVSFNGKAATYKVWSRTYLTATIPSGATTGFVTVVTPSGTLKSNKTFRVTPQITSFNPPSGPVGTPVIITGVSLTQTTRVSFGGVRATTFTVNSDTQVTATVPTGAVTGKITITTPGGTATSATSFTVTP